MTTVLFDEAHGELLSSQLKQNGPETDTWAQLRVALERVGWELAVHPAEEGALSPEVLNEFDILVLAGPTGPLDQGEISSIRDFVKQGNGLLVASNRESLRRLNNKSLNVLLEPFDLRFERSLYYPPDEVTKFYPHYISSGLTELSPFEPTFLGTLGENTQRIADLPWPERPFLAATDVRTGRVVAVGDYSFLGDRLFEETDNRRLALNMLSWLARQNALDCWDARIDNANYVGQTSTFSIVLTNPQPHRLQRIRCMLESDKGAKIDAPTVTIRSIPPGGQTWLTWPVVPQQLGPQALKLTVDLPRSKSKEPLFFDPVARFECRPNARIDLHIVSDEGNPTQSVLVGRPFVVHPLVSWMPDAVQTSLSWGLEYDQEHLAMYSFIDRTANRWGLVGLDPGDWSVALIEDHAGMRIESQIRVRASISTEIERIQRETVPLLDAQIGLLVSRLRPEFDAASIRDIPVRLLTPEEFVREVYPTDAADRLLRALEVTNSSDGMKPPLLEQLLRYIAPLYSPVQGCCIPFAPGLASALARTYEAYEENLAHNFLTTEARDAVWLQQNLAAFLLHEKYGHGFFFTQTALGQQLAFLYRHGLLRPEDRAQLPSPYPRLLSPEYEEAFHALYHSSIIVNEGFAAWLEITILPQLGGVVGQAAYRRKDFLMNRDTHLEDLASNSTYFQRFQPFESSRYREGFEYLNAIVSYFGPEYGPKCAVQAILRAADIHFGVTETNGQIILGLDPDRLTKYLLESTADDARADMRLRRIHETLHDHNDSIRIAQRQLQCHRVCLHADCPVNRVIRQRLGW